MDKIYLPFYYSWQEVTDELTDAEFGHLVRAILNFAKDGETDETMSGAANVAFKFIADTIRRSQVKADAGRKGMAKRWGNAASNKPPNNGVNNTVNNNPVTINRNRNRNINTNTTINTPPISPSKEGETNNNNDNSGAREREDEEQKSGSDEQIAEIKAYFKSKGFEKSAEDFIAYNSGRGWRGIGGECIFDRLTSYMDKWIAEERARSRKPSKPTADKPRQGNFDVTDAFNKALERSYRNDE